VDFISRVTFPVSLRVFVPFHIDSMSRFGLWVKRKIHVVLRFVIVVYEFNNVETLSHLSRRELVLVTIPETSTTCGFGVVTYTMPRKETFHVWICNLRFKLFQVEWRIFTIDTGGTLF
jgi:hypothetical protein